jgi:hypothetical protein
MTSLFTSPLLVEGEIVLFFSLPIFVGALIATFGDHVRNGRR